MRAIAQMANVVTVRQQEPLGLGHAVLCAKDVVGDEPFVVMLGDDIIDAPVPGRSSSPTAGSGTGSAPSRSWRCRARRPPLYGIAAGRGGRPADHPDRAARREAEAGPALEPRRDRPVRAAAARLRGARAGEARAWAARSSSPTRSPCSRARRGCSATGSRATATTRAIGVGYLKANVAFALKRPELAPQLREWLREVIAVSGLRRAAAALALAAALPAAAYILPVPGHPAAHGRAARGALARRARGARGRSPRAGDAAERLAGAAGSRPPARRGERRRRASS